MRNFLNVMLLMTLVFFGCDGITNRKSTEQREQIGVVNTDSLIIERNNTLGDTGQSKNLVDVEMKTWIDDFRDFRMAIYDNDVPKLKTYFNFPFDDPGSTILDLSKISEAGWALRKKQYDNPDLFYEQDLQKYYKKIFDERFTKCILKIKSEVLFSEHIYQTEMFEEPEIMYQMVAEFFPKDRILRLNMSFGNNYKDENGAYISEGEHNVLYTFRIIDNKKIVLQRIDVAG